MQDDRRPRRGKGKRRRDDEGRAGLPGMDSGFFTRDGFEAELDAVAFENTALNNMDPIREAQLFEQFEQDYRSGGYDPGPDPRDISGYREPPSDRPRHGKNRDRRQPSESSARIPQRPTQRPAQRPSSAPSASPFGELTPYLVPILVAVVVVMVIVVLLLNR